VDDYDVSGALLKAVQDWGKERGMTEIVGPLGFSDMDYEGMLIEGYEELSTMATIYNFPYYPRHMQEHGFAKDSDWVEYLIDVPTEVPERYLRITDLVKKKYDLRVIKFTNRKKLKNQYGQALFELINTAYADLYQYCELSDRQIQHYINIYLGLLDLKLVSLVVDKDDKLLGVGISLPSLSHALQKSKGRLFPFGWFHLLRGLAGKTDRVDLLLVAVHPDYQNKGVNSLIFSDLIPQYIKKGFRYAESNPEMETNAKVQNQWDAFPHRQNKRRRSFIKAI
jgi:GNAT superfamily N-acetyltransferase